MLDQGQHPQAGRAARRRRIAARHGRTRWRSISPDGTPTTYVSSRCGAAAKLRHNALASRRHAARLRPSARRSAARSQSNATGPPAPSPPPKPSPPSSASPKPTAAWRQRPRNGMRSTGSSTPETQKARSKAKEALAMAELTNATYDLRTGVGRPPDPLDYITKKTACRCAPPGTPHPLWSQFIDRVTDRDANCRDFCSADRLLLHRLHQSNSVRLRLRHRRQRQVDVHQHRRQHPRRLRHRRRHVDLHRQQHRAPPDRSGQAARRPPGGGAGDRRAAAGTKPRSRR